MSAGASHFEGALDVFLTLHLAEVEIVSVDLLAEHFTGVDDRWLELSLTVQEVDHVDDIVDAIDIQAVDHGGFHNVSRGDEDAVELLASRFDSHRQNAFYGEQRAVEVNPAILADSGFYLVL